MAKLQGTGLIFRRFMLCFLASLTNKEDPRNTLARRPFPGMPTGNRDAIEFTLGPI